MKTKILYCLLSLSLLTACVDPGEEYYTTFDGELIAAYLKDRPETYSEFYALLDKTGLVDLLNAYGDYTCFAPTNEAIRQYYEKVGTSLEQMTPTDIKDLVYNHIITKSYFSIEFPNGIINTANIANRFMYLTYNTSEDNVAVLVNDSSRIVILDQKVSNGVIHTVDHVVEASKIFLPEFIGIDPRFSLFFEALKATRLDDSLRLVQDNDYKSGKVQTKLYNPPFAGNATAWDTPPLFKYGYTAFVESDSLFAENGIHNLDDLKAYAAGVYDRMYPEDKDKTDVTDRFNSLNRFVAYHLLDRMQAQNEFITAIKEKCHVPNTVLYEYIEPLCPNTLIEATNAGRVLSFNKQKTVDGIHIISPNHAAMNGVFHEIDRIMVYDEGVENDVLNKRLRMETASMFPELMTNKIRTMEGCMYFLPRNYLKNMTWTESTEIFYKKALSWSNVEGDEIIVGGKYDFTLRIPPVPAGRYEIRMRYEATSYRGVAQVYLDGLPCGIPVDLTIDGNDPRVGWKNDNTTDDNGIENDKMMRNRGFMKDGNSILVNSSTNNPRTLSRSLRRILTTQSFEKMEPHYLRIKSVEETNVREFQLDYIEFVPSTYLEKEGRD
ncbi:hypothetical protein FACS1894123_09760 [Bacteroidia bacterium]|nr:hypothetical protein FACS1894123_09760 [Bacteroidia bacterium]